MSEKDLTKIREFSIDIYWAALNETGDFTLEQFLNKIFYKEYKKYE